MQRQFLVRGRSHIKLAIEVGGWSTNIAIETAKVLTSNYNNYTYVVDESGLEVLKDGNVDKTVEESSFFDFGLF